MPLDQFDYTLITCAIVTLRLYFFYSTIVRFNESQSRGDSKFTHFQSQEEEVAEALVKSIAIPLRLFRLDRLGAAGDTIQSCSNDLLAAINSILC